MRIPRQVSVGGRRIKVRFVEMEKGVVGKADYENGLILIKAGMKKSAQHETFIHELYHFLNTTMNHGLLDSLSAQTYQIFKANGLWK